jgi:hypothetical protein
MITLDTVDKSIEVVLDAAVTTNELSVVSEFVDIGSSAFGVEGISSEDAATNGTTPVAAVSAPAQDVRRQVKALFVTNTDTEQATVTVQLNNNSTIRQMFTAILFPSETLQYADGEGWSVANKKKAYKSLANSTNVALGAAGGGSDVFTGAGVLAEQQVKVTILFESQPGEFATLDIELSDDGGVTWNKFPFIGYRIGSGIYEQSFASPAGQILRPVLTNLGSAMSSLELSTYVGDFEAFVAIPNDQRQGVDYQALPTRPTEFGNEVVLGKRAGFEERLLSGRNSDIDTGSTPEDLWNGGGVYTGFQPTANEEISVVSSDVNDTGSDVSSGTATGGSETSLEDTGATFITDGVAVGDCLVNETKGSHGIVSNVVSETEVEVYRMEDFDPININTNDAGNSYRIVTATGTGAALVRIDPILDEDFVPQTPVYITLNGTTTVTTTGVNGFRYSFGQIIIAGSAENNVGEITANQAVTTANIMFVMPAGTGQTEVGAFTVPAGFRMLIKTVQVSLVRASGLAGSGTVYLQVIPRGGARRTRRVFEVSNSSGVEQELTGGIIIQEQTDVVWRCTNVSDNNSIIEADADFLLIRI